MIRDLNDLSKFTGWMEFYTQPGFEKNLTNIAEYCFVCHAQNTGSTAYERTVVIPTEQVHALLAAFASDNGLAPFINRYGYTPDVKKPKKAKKEHEVLYANGDSLIIVHTSQINEDRTFVNLHSVDMDVVNKFEAFAIANQAMPASQRGRISLPVVTDDGNLRFALLDTPIADGIYEPLNYSKATNEKFEFALNELQKDSPAGRLVVIQGPTGTGKSFLVRSLIGQLDSKNILFPSALAARLDSPEMHPKLVEAKEESGEESLTIFIEDGDEYLMKRDESNRSKVSTILNLCDGLLSAALNCRIVITSNTPESAMDPAILRAGRLLAVVNADELEPEHANKIFERIAGKPKKEPYTKKVVLAQVYSDANETGFTAVTGQSEPKTGFIR